MKTQRIPSGEPVETEEIYIDENGNLQFTGNTILVVPTKEIETED